jgi:hypothetical protein
MLNYAVLTKKPEHFRNFSGLTIEEFNTLNQQITQKHPTHEQKRPKRTTEKETSTQTTHTNWT